MLRAVQALIIVSWLISQAYAQDTIPSLNLKLDWFTKAVPKPEPPKPPKKTEAIQVQEPYCEFGAGACGGMCSEESGKRWNCEPTAIPCYQRGQHCACEVASMCLPKKKP
jgi:hypothetical protein